MTAPPPPPREIFDTLARRALEEYHLGGLPFTFLQHSENVTYRVRKPDDGSYLLRLHIPAVPAIGFHGADAAAVKSELLWLEALRRETDLPLQTPVRNKRGQLVSQLTTEEQDVNCSLLEWLEGEPYEREDESEYTAAQLGMLVGKLHTFSSHWHLPAGFMRPKRDKSYFEQSLKALEPAVEDGRIGYRDFRELEVAIQTLVELMQSLHKSRHIEGLLHGDLHRGNFLYANGQIKLIDFSYCAFGNYLLDIAICLSDMNVKLHPFFLKNYQTLFELPEEHERLIESFFLGSSVGTLALWIDNPLAQETLVHRASIVAQEFAARFNNDERFWFDQNKNFV